MQVADFDFQLPEELIAQAPVTPRDASRLLVLPAPGAVGAASTAAAPGDGSANTAAAPGDGSASTAPQHRAFADLPELLLPGDLLVFNDTRVIPARLLGVRDGTGGKVEMLLTDPLGGELPRRWRALGKAGKAIRPGVRLRFGELTAEVEAVEGEGFYVLRLDREGPALEAALATAGRLPLPPYIRRAPDAADAERYQTIFAARPGSAAAPTAGLHFTAGILSRLEARGVARTAVTLHVGPGTFLPVRGDTLEGHRMHEERYGVSEAAAEAVAACRARGGRVVAVGTTALRTLESAFEDGRLRPGAGRTALFVRPGYAFRVVDRLVTNFHLPRSTLLMLVCALAGRERVLAAYAEAVACRYRFFSYGDAMLLTRG